MSSLQQLKPDIQIRADLRFNEEIKEIKKLRLELGIDRVKVSDRFITSLIVRHNSWKKVKEDIINYGGQDES